MCNRDGRKVYSLTDRGRQGRDPVEIEVQELKSRCLSKGIRQFRENRRPEHIHFFKSLPIELYGPLLKNAGCLIGNSSSGIREAGFLGTPTVNIGTRQQGRQRGPNVVDVPYEREAIKAAILKQMSNGCYDASHIYGDGDAASKIAEVLAGFEVSIQKRSAY